MVSTSALKKSAAARPSPCAARNVFQGVFVPSSGTGSMPWSLRIALIVLGGSCLKECPHAVAVREDSRRRRLERLAFLIGMPRRRCQPRRRRT
jgi:hypothetical protein